MSATTELEPTPVRGQIVTLGALAEQPSMGDAPGAEYFYWLCQQARTVDGIKVSGAPDEVKRAGANGFAFHFFPWTMEAEYQTALEPGETVVPAQQPDHERRAREEALVQMGASPEQLKWYRQKVNAKGGLAKTDQEYASDPDVCFIVSGAQFFDKSRTEALLAAAQLVKPINEMRIVRPGAVGTLVIFSAPVPGRRYVVISDASEGTGGDRGTGQVWECGTGRHMATLAGQFRPPELARECERLGYAYASEQVPALIAVERNNHGHAVLQELEREDPASVPPKDRKRRYPRIFKDYDDKLGWITHEVSRSAALSALEQVHREGKWGSPCASTLSEMRTFVVNRRGKAAGAAGAKDDLVITAAIAWDVLARADARGGAPRAVGTGWGG